MPNIQEYAGIKTHYLINVRESISKLKAIRRLFRKLLRNTCQPRINARNLHPSPSNAVPHRRLITIRERP